MPKFKVEQPNRAAAIITGLLREKCGYDGVVCTDWGLITGVQIGDACWPLRAWGVEHLGEAGRMRKALDAGVDQFGARAGRSLWWN